MKENIILAPGCNGTELLRALARFGVNTIGYRVLSDVELAKIALMRSGISITEDFLSSREEPSVIFSFLNKIEYFRSASYADAEALSAAIHTMRSLVTGHEEDKLKEALSASEFKSKNDAIYEIYKLYLKTCRSDNKIDSISLIRKAIESAAPFTANFITITEYELSPIDRELIEKLSGGNITVISLDALYNAKENQHVPYVFTEGYGTVNEIEDIINYIYINKISLDKCVIACPGGSEYPQTFYDLSKRYGIPVTYGSGIPIVNSYPARLLKLISEWDTLGYHGIDALRRIITSEAFDRKKFEEVLGSEELSKADIEDICAMAGALRIAFNRFENDSRISNYRKSLEKAKKKAELSGIPKNIKSADRRLTTIDRVEKLSSELSKGFIEFFNRFALLRPEPMLRIDQSAKQVITEGLNAYETYVNNANVNDIVPQLLGKTVSSENSKEGRLHLTSISGAMASMRENLFVCGLSASEFPGSPSENYLLLDEDLLSMNKEKAQTSTRRIETNKNSLDHLLNLAQKLGTKTRLSYSGYNLADLKEKNPSSVLFKYYESENNGAEFGEFKKAIRKVGYFDSAISDTRLICKEYVEGKGMIPNPFAVCITSAGNPMNKAWSPSALEIFFQCPRHFYLAKVLGIPEEEPDNPFDVWTAADAGTLAHSMMEELAASKANKESFMTACEDAFEEFLLSRPPIHRDEADMQKKDFLKMMSSAYDQEMLINNEVLTAEEEYKHTHPSGVKLHGYPDRVEKDSNGNYIIADFKTKRKVEHIENDINTCLQVVIYAWLCEQEGITISRCDYRYLRKNKTISCVYNANKRNELNDMLCTFKKAIETNSFPRNESKDNCKYCKLADICALHD